jgi:shikimate kinase
MSIFLICNSITGKATVSSKTAEGIERAFAYKDTFIKRGPEQVICEFSDAIGINLTNFALYPKSMIWDGVASYARRK